MATETEKLLQQQAELIAQFKVLLARNPGKEFDYGEGYVGASKGVAPSPTLDAACVGFAAGVALYSSPLLVQQWRISHAASDTIAVVNMDSITSALQLEFSNSPDFKKIYKTWAYYRRSTITTQYTVVNTALQAAALDLVLPLRMRHLRATIGYFSNDENAASSGKFIPSSSLFGNFAGLIVETLGE